MYLTNRPQEADLEVPPPPPTYNAHPCHFCNASLPNYPPEAATNSF